MSKHLRDHTDNSASIDSVRALPSRRRRRLNRRSLRPFSGRIMTTVAVLGLLVGGAIAATATDASFHGAAAGYLHSPVVGMTSSASGNGYWLAAADGGVFNYGDAANFPNNIRPLNRPVVGISRTVSGNGYWLVASDGGVFSFGDAQFLGSTGNLRLNQPIVGMAATPSGRGYWLVASDGGVFSFGDATFYGSTGNMSLNRPIIGMASSPNGQGYWLAASDGGIFAFGDAHFMGSTGGIALAKPIVSIMTSRAGNGYTLVGADGGLFGFGQTDSWGGIGMAISQNIAGTAMTVNGSGYWMVTASGAVFAFGPPRTDLGAGLSDKAPAGSKEQNIAADILKRVNLERVSLGRDPLAWDFTLATQASGWSRTMAATGRFEHSNAAPSEAENISWGSGSYADSGSAETGFLMSDNHRWAMLDSRYTSVGIGAFCAADGTLWVTENFRAHPTLGAGPSVPQTPLNPHLLDDDNGVHC